MLSNNKVNLVLSILAAIVIWVFVTTTVNPVDEQTIRGVTVVLENLDTLEADGFTVRNDVFAVDVKVSGTRSELQKLSAEDFTATANVKGYSIGVNRIDVDVTGPKNVRVVTWTPSRIEVEVVELVSVTKPIRLEYKGKFAAGTEPGLVTLSPREIDVSGTKEEVGKVSYVGALINKSDLSDSETTLTVDAVPRQKNGQEVFDVSLSQQTIDVTLTLCHVKEVPLNIEIVGEPAEGMEITNTDIPDTVFIRGSEEAIKNIDSVRAKDIDVSGATATLKVEPELDLPENVELADESAGLEVTIEIGGIIAKDFEITAENIEIENLPEGYAANVNTGTIRITVFGSPAYISHLTARDITVFVDMSDVDMQQGFADIEPQFRYDEKFKINSISAIPDKLRIIITKLPENSTGTNVDDSETEVQSESEVIAMITTGAAESAR